MQSASSDARTFAIDIREQYYDSLTIVLVSA